MDAQSLVVLLSRLYTYAFTGAYLHPLSPVLQDVRPLCHGLLHFDLKRIDVQSCAALCYI